MRRRRATAGRSRSRPSANRPFRAQPPSPPSTPAAVPRPGHRPVAVEALTIGLDDHPDRGPATSTIRRFHRSPTMTGKLTLGRSTPARRQIGRKSSSLTERTTAGSRAAVVLRDQLGEATAFQQPQRLSGHQERFQLGFGVRRGEVDEEDIDRYAGDRAVDPGVAGVDLATVDGDPRTRPAGAGRRADVGSRGRDLRDAQMLGARGAAEVGAGPAGEHGCQPPLLTRVGRRMGGVDAAMKPEEPAGVDAPLNAGSAPAEFDQLPGGDQPEATGGEPRDLLLSTATGGRFCLSLRMNPPAVGHTRSLPSAGARVGSPFPSLSKESVTPSERSLGRPRLSSQLRARSRADRLPRRRPRRAGRRSCRTPRSRPRACRIGPSRIANRHPRG